MQLYSRKIKDIEKYKEAQLELQKIMRDVVEFNNTIDSNYTYVPDLNALFREAEEQLSFNLRTYRGGADTYREKQKLPERYGTEMN